MLASSGLNLAAAGTPVVGEGEETPQSIGSLRGWLTGQAWPLWRDHGVDRAAGGFHEALDPTTLTCPVAFRRLRVLTRQIHVFSCAACHGLEGADALVEFGMDILLRRARQPDGAYAWRFALDGSVIDQRRDLYDHAFVLLALSSAATVLTKPRLRAEALALMAWLDTHMKHPAGGYVEALPLASGPRRQNPHMHMLEASLAAWDVFGEPLFLERADQMVALFLDCFFDRTNGTLPELFGERLSPLPWDQGNWIEPGHLAEWISLLARHKLCLSQAGRAVPEQAALAASALQSFLDRSGVHPAHGALVDAVSPDGRVLSAGARLWPQTERLKSDALHLSAGPERLSHAVSAIAPYLDHPVKGLWYERRTPEGAFAQELVPASSLYHLTEGILFAHAQADTDTGQTSEP